jgi:hypothetical protein
MHGATIKVNIKTKLPKETASPSPDFVPSFTDLDDRWTDGRNARKINADLSPKQLPTTKKSTVINTNGGLAATKTRENREDCLLPTRLDEESKTS